MRYLEQLEQGLINAGAHRDYIDLCISYASRLIDCGMPVVFNLDHFSKLLGIELDRFMRMLYISDALYRTLRIPKKRGGYRTISIPTKTLRYTQRWILDNMLVNMRVSKSAMGFQEGCSIVKNAACHLNHRCILSLDIKDFFPSITYEDVFGIFRYYGYTHRLSNLFARLCTVDQRLPQGAPTSPALSNIRCLRMDKRIQALCSRYNAIYTRYADDITISADCDLSTVKQIVIGIINDEGFEVNDKKTHIAYAHQHQEVTGIVVNNGEMHIPKSFKRKLKQQIYYCQKYGPSDHQNHIGDQHNFYKEHLYGKAYYIKMVEPEVGEKILQELDKINWDS